MGYTHYWYRNTQTETPMMYGKLALEAKWICGQATRDGIWLADGSGRENTEPLFTEGAFALNGVGPESCESLYWTATPEAPPGELAAVMGMSDWSFDFTKTRGRPYDAVVCAILLTAKYHYGDALHVESDGEWSDWISGRDLYHRVTGREPVSPFRRAA